MKRIIPFAMLALLVSVFVSTAQVEAQSVVYDHMKCFKIKDPAKFAAKVDLTAFQELYNGLPLGCALAGKAKLFCVPVNKKVTAFADKSKPPLQPSQLAGQDLKFDQLCYKIKCPRPVISTQDVRDQFGARPVKGFVPALLCTPTIKEDAPPPPCEQSQAPQCGGVCPDPTLVCRPANDGTLNCDCIPINPPCKESAPTCDGACPNPAQVCVQTAAAGCFCSDQVPCEQSSAPQCGGVCPVGSPPDCRPDTTGKCRCQEPDPVPCTGSFPQCGGDCPNAGEVCFNFGQTCDCVRPCGEIAPGQCDGQCPAGSQCNLNTANQCSCN